MRIVIVADTHTYHDTLGVLEGDILLHCGDLCYGMLATKKQLDDADRWLGKQKFKTIVCIGGNHDRPIQRRVRSSVKPVLHNAIYLQDEEIVVEGLKIYGTPWIPLLAMWSFYLNDESLRQKWAQIPNDVDILMTHTPPKGILDFSNMTKTPAGCPHLAERVAQIKPKIHCFGHIHEAYGRIDTAETIFINAAVLAKKSLNEPFVIDL